MSVYVATHLLWLALGAGEPPAPTADEMMLLQALRDRRVELDHREMELNAQARQLDQLAKKVEERLGDVEKQMLALETRLNIGEPRRRAREKKVGTLVETLSTLSAKKAAPLLAQADPELVGDLLLRLGPERTAALLSAMPSPQAGRIVDIVGEARLASEARRQGQEAEAAAEGGAGARPRGAGKGQGPTP